MIIYSNKRIIDRKVKGLHIDKSGNLTEINEVLYSNNRNKYIDVKSRYKEKVYLSNNLTDKPVMDYLYETIGKFFDLQEILFLRKHRKQKGLFTGFYGIEIKVTIRTRIKDENVLQLLNSKIKDLVPLFKRKFRTNLTVTDFIKPYPRASKSLLNYDFYLKCYPSFAPFFLETKEFQEGLEDRFCDFDEDFKTKTSFIVVKQPDETILLTIKFNLEKPPSDELIRRFSYSIYWIEKLFNLRSTHLFGEISFKSLMGFRFKKLN